MEGKRAQGETGGIDGIVAMRRPGIEAAKRMTHSEQPQTDIRKEMKLLMVHAESFKE